MEVEPEPKLNTQHCFLASLLSPQYLNILFKTQTIVSVSLFVLYFFICCALYAFIVYYSFILILLYQAAVWLVTVCSPCPASVPASVTYRSLMSQVILEYPYLLVINEEVRYSDQFIYCISSWSLQCRSVIIPVRYSYAKMWPIS